MPILSDNKYKDEKPMKTIKIIKNTLEDIGIEVEEDFHLHSVEAFHSIHLKVKGAKSLYVNGKGTTYEYALASAYGEFMERLQNQALYKYKVDLSDEATNYLDFYSAVDEKYMDMEELVEEERVWLSRLFPAGYHKQDMIEVLQELKFSTPDKYNCDFVGIPFYNIHNHRLNYVPTNILDFCYCTNGMSAGNSKEEGLVQGLSEILERHINKKMHHEKLTPPTIPLEALERFELPYNMIKRIQASDQYDVIIKDCSLGGKYPVVGLIIIDKNTHKYFCKFGCHPVFEIALERTLTELLQGKSIDNIFDMASFSYKNRKVNTNENYESILTNGAGFYPSEYFGEEYSYPFVDIEDRSSLDNEEMLRYLVQIITDEGYDILVRDVSFLDFPTYHIIVPGMSEIHELNMANVREEKVHKDIRHQLRHLDKIEDQDIENIITYMKSKYYTNKDSIMNVMRVPLDDTISYNNLKTNLFFACLYYKANRYDEAYKELNTYVRYLKKITKVNKMAFDYYKCCRDYIGGKSEGQQDNAIKSILVKFYGDNMVDKVIEDLKSPRDIFKYHNTIQCWDCDQCEVRGNCSYDTVKRMHTTLKERQKKANLNQVTSFEKLFA